MLILLDPAHGHNTPGKRSPDGTLLESAYTRDLANQILTTLQTKGHNAQILAWNALARTQAGKSVLGTSAKISGANLYSRLNYWIVFCGGEALSNPPALQGVEASTEAVVTLTPTKFTFELESEPENVQDLKLIIQASAPQSNGVTRAYSKAVQIGGVLEAVTEEYDIKEDYDNKHGAPNAAAPKVFMKYFFVNTKTGEKSGEMLTMVRLDEDAPADGE